MRSFAFLSHGTAVASTVIVLAATACSSTSATSSSGGCVSSQPSGSYSRSCTGCTMNGTVLSCQGCGDGHGGNPSASLDTCSCASAEATNGISNNHGVLECGAASTGGGGTAPDSGPTCSSIGSCGPSSDNCKCGLSCLHIGEGRYTCGYSCTTAQDCAGKTNPSSGSPWNSCEPPHTGALDISYEGYCL